MYIAPKPKTIPIHQRENAKNNAEIEARGMKKSNPSNATGNSDLFIYETILFFYPDLFSLASPPHPGKQPKPP
jgi:hypothetical protein